MTVSELIAKVEEKHSAFVVMVNNKFDYEKHLNKKALGFEYDKNDDVLKIYIGDNAAKLDIDFIITRAAIMRQDGLTKQQANEILGKSIIYK